MSQVGCPFVCLCSITTVGLLLWKHCLSSLSPKGEKQNDTCKWTCTHTVNIHSSYWYRFSSKLIPIASADLYGYNKGKVTYKVNFDGVDNLIGVRLLIICKVPDLKPVMVYSNSHRWAGTKAWLHQRRLHVNRKKKKSNNCVIFPLLVALRYNTKQITRDHSAPPKHGNLQRPCHLSVALRTHSGGEMSSHLQESIARREAYCWC